jgi:subfamily B ATP-binding cassette protein HlyB/CyaB
MQQHIKPEPHIDSNNSGQRKIDSGLSCLVMIAKYHGVTADQAQIKHAFAIGNDGAKTLDILRAAKELGFKAREAKVEFERLQRLPMPAIVEMNRPLPQGENGQIANGERQYVILAKAEADKLLILHPAENNPRIVKKDEFLAQWAGKIILITHRGLKAFSDEVFGLKWFIPSIWKYRKPLSEVLIASMVLQVFALVTPIFTQVIIDKVLVHRGLTTLNVLAIGLIAIAMFGAFFIFKIQE